MSVRKIGGKCIMGLFSNKKNPCVLCGEPTPRLFAREACGGKLCGDCGKKVSMQEEILQGISLDDLRQHMKYREDNQKLHETFKDTRCISFEGEKLIIDDEQKLFYLTSFAGKNDPIFRFDELVGFAYIESMEGKLEQFIASNKLFLKGEERIVHEQGVRVVYEYTKDYKEKKDSLLELYKEEYRGVAYSKNLLNHIIGLDDAMMSREKPVKQMYLVFEFDNPYWNTYRKDVLEPVVRNHDDEDKGKRDAGRREYIRIYENKLKDIDKIADAMKSILDA